MQSSNHSTSTTDAAREKHHEQVFVSSLCCCILTTWTWTRYDNGQFSWAMIHHVINLAFILNSTAIVLFSDPENKIVEVNEWAQFNCTARCGYSVGWYMAGNSRVIKRNNTVPGLLIKIRRASCTESNRTHFIEVLATEQFNKSTFYCAAYERRKQSCSCGTGGRCYSRPALLTGKNF